MSTDFSSCLLSVHSDLLMTVSCSLLNIIITLIPQFHGHIIIYLISPTLINTKVFPPNCLTSQVTLQWASLYIWCLTHEQEWIIIGKSLESGLPDQGCTFFIWKDITNLLSTEFAQKSWGGGSIQGLWYASMCSDSCITGHILAVHVWLLLRLNWTGMYPFPSAGSTSRFNALSLFSLFATGELAQSA